MKTTFKLMLALLVTLAMRAESRPAAPKSWEDRAFWYGAVENVTSFFDDHAWDEASGSYASEIGEKGDVVSDLREIVPLSRMIYADVTAPAPLGNPTRARRSADFVLRRMLARDGIGLWFRSAVDSRGRVPRETSPRPYTFIFEQAYALSGLVALYRADPVANADLLPVIRSGARDFWARFHDPVHGGLFYYYNFRERNHANDRGQVHKSYQSTVYPISSFLLALRDVDARNRALYDGWIDELLDVAVRRIVETRDGVPTGWLRERMAPDFSVDATYVMSEAGHVTQLSWVLGVAVEKGIVRDPRARRLYVETARSLLHGLLEHGGVAATGAVYDAFDRTTGRPLRDPDGKATSAWWSNLEAIIAYSFAVRHHWGSVDTTQRWGHVLNGLTQAYYRYFIDHEHGGEYFRVNAETGEVVDATKGNGGKSGYHLVEAYRYVVGSAEPRGSVFQESPGDDNACRVLSEQAM